MNFYRNEQHVAITTPADSHRHGFHFIHQELNYVPQLSVAENIFINQPYPRRAGLFVNWRELQQQADAILNRVGVDHINVKTQMAKLTTGDKMLVRIASAFADSRSATTDNHHIYVMDEPTAALTSKDVGMLFAVIRNLVGQGHSVLYVSHRLDEIFDIANTITVMRNGEVVLTEPVAALSHDNVIHAMTGRELESVYPPRTAPIKTAPLLDVKNMATAQIHDITFSLKQGEILGVIGLRDNGQTELLHALLGLNPITTGQVIFDGQPLPTDISHGWEQGIAYIPRERRAQGIVPGRSVRDNMMLPHAHRYGIGQIFVNHAQEQSLSEKLRRDVQLRAQSIDQHVRELSGGNQQKVVFARALLREPRLIIMDEPTRGVDVGAKYDIYQIIRRISESGTGVIMASSDLPEIIGMCDRVLVMRNGTLHTIVDTTGLSEAALLQYCYDK